MTDLGLLLALTVDGDSNDFGQNEIIRTMEGRDSVEGVELLVVDGCIWRASIDELDV